MNFWNSLKEHSAAALEVVSKDLKEFTETVTTDTSIYLKKPDVEENDSDADRTGMEEIQTEETENSRAAVLAAPLSYLSVGLERIGDSVLKTAQSILEGEADAEEQSQSVYMAENAIPLPTTKAIPLPTTNARERISVMQNDANTYARPVGPARAERYEAFCEEYVYTEKRKIQSRSMLEQSNILQIYHDLVPAEVDENEFWRRYFFWEHELMNEEREVQSSTEIAKLGSQAGGRTDPLASSFVDVGDIHDPGEIEDKRKDGKDTFDMNPVKKTESSDSWTEVCCTEADDKSLPFADSCREEVGNVVAEHADGEDEETGDWDEWE
jgi:hypothetical protein